MRSARSGGSTPPGPLALRRDRTILRGQRGSAQHPARPPPPSSPALSDDGRTEGPPHGTHLRVQLQWKSVRAPPFRSPYFASRGAMRCSQRSKCR